MIVRLIIVGIVGAFLHAPSVSLSTDEPIEQQLVHLFSEMNVQTDQFILHHSSRTSRTIQSEDMDAFVSKWIHDLGLRTVKKTNEKDGIRYVSERDFGSDFRLKCVIVNDKPNENVNYPYLSIQLIGKGKPTKHVMSIRGHIEDVIQSYGMIPTFRFTLQGGKTLSNIERESLEAPIKAIMKRLEAQEVESMRTNQTVSVSMFSPHFSETLRTRGGLMNLQVATRVNRDTNQMMITIGSPIITIEY
ncbi:YwmB family TATA-box binding protein [Hazenella sp. IB182357]|uniref:YwmB family TATA-box binding protein n=1 Tax=Polycladospora coralii TaxID=2771432 RepID=A0A926RX40_9BACL|nr:YwmB family TATA-box binding protein [Polycladospora coralii]MBD1372166.1 YwmB family TATA-box binding protein [Polycladospora coralii]MBS7530665.1 YwmB family TATA-box binding protein [Polycladospora coralii]